MYVFLLRRMPPGLLMRLGLGSAVSHLAVSDGAVMYTNINVPMTRGYGLIKRLGQLFTELKEDYGRRPVLILRGSGTAQSCRCDYGTDVIMMAMGCKFSLGEAAAFSRNGWCADDPICAINDGHLQHYQRYFGDLLDSPPQFERTGHYFHLEQVRFSRPCFWHRKDWHLFTMAALLPQPEAVHATILRFLRADQRGGSLQQSGALGAVRDLGVPLLGSE